MSKTKISPSPKVLLATAHDIVVNFYAIDYYGEDPASVVQQLDKQAKEQFNCTFIELALMDHFYPDSTSWGDLEAIRIGAIQKVVNKLHKRKRAKKVA